MQKYKNMINLIISNKSNLNSYIIDFNNKIIDNIDILVSKHK